MLRHLEAFSETSYYRSSWATVLIIKHPLERGPDLPAPRNDPTRDVNRSTFTPTISSTPPPDKCYHSGVQSSRTRHAKAITIINLKGGVGKTHTTWLLTGVCEELEKRCLAVDLDQQGNLSRNLLAGESFECGSEVLFRPGADIEPQQVIQPSKFAHVDLIPAGSNLQPLDLTDQRQWEKADLHLSLVDLVAEVRTDYDFILFDWPTKLSLCGFAALTASDFAIAPLEPADWGAQGIVQVTEAIDYVRRHHAVSTWNVLPKTWQEWNQVSSNMKTSYSLWRGPGISIGNGMIFVICLEPTDCEAIRRSSTISRTTCNSFQTASMPPSLEARIPETKDRYDERHRAPRISRGRRRQTPCQSTETTIDCCLWLCCYAHLHSRGWMR